MTSLAYGFLGDLVLSVQYRLLLNLAMTAKTGKIIKAVPKMCYIVPPYTKFVVLIDRQKDKGAIRSPLINILLEMLGRES